MSDEESKQVSAEEDDRPDATTAEVSEPLAPPRLPHAWGKLAIQFVALLIGALLCGVLLTRYDKVRAVNLQPETRALATRVLDVLVSNQIPAGNIEFDSGACLSNHEAVWGFYRVGVEVPEFLSLDGLERVLRRAMSRSDVTVATAAEGEQDRRLNLFLGDYRFAGIHLHSYGPSGERIDLRSECKAIASKVAETLEGFGIPQSDYTKTEPKLKQTRSTIWYFVRIEAAIPEDVPERDLVNAISETLEERRRVQIVDKTKSAAETQLTISCRGRECLRLVLQLSAPGPSEDGSPDVELPRSPDRDRSRDIKDILSISLPEPDELPQESSEFEERHLRKEPAEKPKEKPPCPKVAIIMDDGGYGGSVTESILKLDTGLTLAILPNTPFAAATAERGACKGFEIILHMPMGQTKFPGRLTADMNQQQITALTENALGQVLNVVGVNNHAGSEFTADADAMARFLSVIKHKGLFFVDSRTTPETKGYDVARAHKIPSAERDVFLDNESSAGYIRGQFNHLVEVAVEHGQAIGIGHFRESTVEILAEMLPKLNEKGVKLVHVSELVK